MAAIVAIFPDLMIIRDGLSRYLNTSFWNKRPDPSRRDFLDGALWDIRDRFGRDFTDEMLRYTFRAMMDYPSKQGDNFQEYVLRNLKIGELVKDDNGERWPQIADILRKYRLTVPQ